MDKKELMIGEIIHKDTVTIGGITFECHPVELGKDFIMCPKFHVTDDQIIIDGIDIVKINPYERQTKSNLR